VSVREQASIVVGRLRSHGTMSFRSLVADADSTLVVVARFLSLLELFKEAVVSFEQAEALGELDVRWTGEDREDVEITGEFDDVDAADAADMAAAAVIAGGESVTERDGDPSDEEQRLMAEAALAAAADIPAGQDHEGGQTNV
jgi:segregation and condensation protein A